MMMRRYLLTLDRHNRQTRSGLPTEANIIEALAAGDLPSIMPPD